jgi:hypothetical protein
MKQIRTIFILPLAALLLATGCANSTVISVNTPVPDAQNGTPDSGGKIDVPGVSIQVYAPGPNPEVDTPDAHGAPAGVLLGIWHGIISPITLVASFLNSNGQMYEVHNDGSPYNLGFLLGVAIVFVFLGVFAGSRRR